jgi:RNA polymerase-binding transcription factor
MKSQVTAINQPELTRHRTILEARLTEAEGSNKVREQLAIEASADPLDMIRMSTDRDLVVQRLNLNTRMISDIRAALQALDRGEYGICEDCEERIPNRRLDAIPWAQVCVRCQESRDDRAFDGQQQDFYDAA